MLEVIEERQDREARNICNQSQEIKEPEMSKEIFIDMLYINWGIDNVF